MNLSEVGKDDYSPDTHLQQVTDTPEEGRVRTSFFYQKAEVHQTAWKQSLLILEAQSQSLHQFLGGDAVTEPVFL